MDYVDPSELFGYSSSSSSSGYMNPSTSPTEDEQNSPPEEVQKRPDEQSLVKVRRKPMPRKGHTKSRRGCFSCKKRKIKCQETLPKCENCSKAGMACEYPKKELTLPQPPNPNPIMQPQATPKVFTMQDMRYFHYFLTTAYPHLPVGADELWQLEIPAQAHDCDYLMHSILGLGASHLALTTPDPAQMQEQALAHRIKAVNGLNEAFTKPVSSTHDADARFATLMNLTYQSACIRDGLAEFMTMLRGCVLQGVVCDGMDTAFRSMDPIDHINIMTQRFGEVNLESIPIDMEALDQGLASLNAVEPHCRPGVELQYFNLLKNLIVGSYVSPANAYFALTELYNIVGLLPPEEFKKLLDPDNPVCRVLLGHFLAVHVITRPVALIERPHREASILYDMLETWVCLLHDSLDPTFRRLHQWPLSFIGEAGKRRLMTR